jgi:hypothetical protein
MKNLDHVLFSLLIWLFGKHKGGKKYDIGDDKGSRWLSIWSLDHQLKEKHSK